jgi:hypothetical protein
MKKMTTNVDSKAVANIDTMKNIHDDSGFGRKSPLLLI